MKPFNSLVCLQGKCQYLLQEDFFDKDIAQINILVMLFRSKYYDDSIDNRYYMSNKQKIHLFKFQKLYLYSFLIYFINL